MTAIKWAYLWKRKVNLKVIIQTSYSEHGFKECDWINTFFRWNKQNSFSSSFRTKTFPASEVLRWTITCFSHFHCTHRHPPFYSREMVNLHTARKRWSLTSKSVERPTYIPVFSFWNARTVLQNIDACTGFSVLREKGWRSERLM